MALGASRRDVVALVVGRMMRPVVAGSVVGIIGAVGAAQLLSRMLFGLSPLDPIAFLGTTTLLGCVALLASYVPARRALRLDPIIALRDS